MTVSTKENKTSELSLTQMALVLLWRSRKSAAVKVLAEQHIERLDLKIKELRAMRKALSELVQRCRGDSRPDCPILDDFQLLTDR